VTRPTSPVPPSTLATDHATVLALQSLVDYQPLDSTISIANLLQVQGALFQAKQNRQAIEVALDHARRVESETSHIYHSLVVNSRVHVVAQYGPDSAAVTLVGLTRKSERKRRARRKAVAV
jgi:hypothetical protein